MRASGIAVAVLLLVTTVGAQSEVSWSDLLQQITSQLVSLWQSRELEFIGQTCYYNQRPRIYRWQLYFHGKFSCPTLSGIMGEYKTRSRSGVMPKTIEDYLNKVKSAGLVTEQEASEWLASHSG